jgi:hypothetical protein
MEVVKRKILLEDSTDRTLNSPNWGVMTATTFYINVFLSQNMDDMGLFTDMSYLSVDNSNPTSNPAVFYNDLYSNLTNLGIIFPFMTGSTTGTIPDVTGTTKNILRLTSDTESTYYNFGNSVITGSTDTKIGDLKTYNTAIPYKVAFDINTSGYYNYNNVPVSGHSRIVSLSDPKIYVFDAITGGTEGTPSQVYGLQYQDYSGRTRGVIIDGRNVSILLTNFSYIGEGWNQRNVSLSALTKEEYLFGIISPPEVQSDVFIDRGITSVMDKHLRFSEIKNLEVLINYGNGYYKLTRE